MMWVVAVYTATGFLFAAELRRNGASLFSTLWAVPFWWIVFIMYLLARFHPDSENKMKK